MQRGHLTYSVVLVIEYVSEKVWIRPLGKMIYISEISVSFVQITLQVWENNCIERIGTKSLAHTRCSLKALSGIINGTRQSNYLLGKTDPVWGKLSCNLEAFTKLQSSRGGQFGLG